jgi:hypothetical protein
MIVLRGPAFRDAARKQVGDRQDAERRARERRYSTVAAARTRLGLPYFWGVECYVEREDGRRSADAKPAQALAPHPLLDRIS